MRRNNSGAVDVTPSARRLTGSLRDIGYDFAAALADIVDNSVTAQATEVSIEIVFEGENSYVCVADNGNGMSETELTEALRFGSRREYGLGELGRYGLGLKTASISQCRRLTVASRRALTYRRVAVRTLDLDHIDHVDRWEVIDPPADSRLDQCIEWLHGGPGTVVLWERLDRILPDRNPEGGWAKRRLDQLAERSRNYLGMVFHRYIEGHTPRPEPLRITVNGEKVAPWNPFAPTEEHRLELPPQLFEIAIGDVYGYVTLQRYVLPPRSRFSSIGEFERMSGPAKWNRQQGIYVYRAHRLIQHGGWSGIRAADEHTKFARASLDFQTDLDGLFQINVAKMRASMPPEIRTLLERPIHELCQRADSVYRRESERGDGQDPGRDTARRVPESRSRAGTDGIASLLMTAALDAGEYSAFARIMDKVKELDPDSAQLLGW